MIGPVKRRFFPEEGGSAGQRFAFPLLAVLILLLFHAPLRMLAASALESDLYSHIALIPFVSLFLLHARRKEIFRETHVSAIPGAVLLAGAAAVHLLGDWKIASLSRNDYLSLQSLGLILGLWGGFVFGFGTEAFRRAVFPLLFLLFTVPVPGFLMDPIVLFLQKWSAEVSSGIFQAIGVPVYRDGYIFSLPGLTVEVAKQCGGIRSSLSLFIVSILAGHLFLRTVPGRIALSAAVLPITVFKNAVRIVFLSAYGAYVNPGILSGVAHRRGGIPFFIGAMALLGAVLFAIGRLERRSGSAIIPPESRRGRR